MASTLTELANLRASIDKILRDSFTSGPPVDAAQAAEKAGLRKVVFINHRGGRHDAYLERIRDIGIQEQGVLLPGGQAKVEPVPHADLIVNVKPAGAAPKWCSIEGVLHYSNQRRAPSVGGWMTLEELAGAEAGRQHTAKLESKRGQ